MRALLFRGVTRENSLYILNEAGPLKNYTDTMLPLPEKKKGAALLGRLPVEWSHRTMVFTASIKSTTAERATSAKGAPSTTARQCSPS